MESKEINNTIPESACKICEDVATGINYGVTTCDACRAFYKRSLGRQHEFQCKSGGSCGIDPRTRTRCKACRLKKCLDQGMTVDAAPVGTRLLQEPVGETILQVDSGTFGDPVAVSGRRAEATANEPTCSRNTADELVLSDAAERPTSFHTILAGVLRRFGERPRHSENQTADRSRLARRSRSPQRPSLVSFSDRNLNYTLSDFSQEFVRPCLVPDIRMPGSSDFQQVMQPSTLQKYWGVMRTRTNALEDTIKAVADATETVFGKRNRARQDFFDRLYVQRLIPYQPECSMQQMMKFMQKDTAAYVKEFFRFTALLPGFSNLSPTDQAAIVHDRWLLIWMITLSYSFRDNETHHSAGPYEVHYCRYWMELMLEKHYIWFMFAVAEEFNELHLSVAETYLLLAVSFFRLDSADSVEDKGYVDFLYSHYLDALVHVMGPDRADSLAKLRQVIKRFSIVNEVHRRYLLKANMSQVPLGGVWESDEIAALIQQNPDNFARTDFQPAGV